jgi:hypothetical protein
LTGDQHTDHIATGQQLSRHSLPTLLYFFIFPTAHFFNSNKRSDSRAPLKEKLNKRVVLLPPHKWHIWFCPTHKPTLAKPKEPFFAHAPFCPRTDNDIEHLKLKLADRNNIKY